MKAYASKASLLLKYIPFLGMPFQVNSKHTYEFLEDKSDNVSFFSQTFIVFQTSNI